MARQVRKESPTGFYHWITRGIHRKVIFHNANDFHVFLCLLNEFRCQFDVRVHHYCIMDNHAHLLIHSDDPANISPLSRELKRRYALYYCGKYHWVGRTFQDRHRLLPIMKESHLLACARYIERNPIKAKKVLLAQDYLYSSSRVYFNGFDPYGLVEPTETYLDLGRTDEERIRIYAQYTNDIQDNEDEDLCKVLVE